MVAAGVLVDLRRPPELPPHDHGDVVGQAAGVEILDQGRDPLVELRGVFPAGAEVVAVVVPEAVAQRHAAHPRLDQPPRGEELLHQPRGAVPLVLLGAVAVAVADFLRLARHVERLGQPARREDAERLALERVHPGHHPRAVGRAVERVERRDQPGAVAEALERQSVEDQVAAGIAVGLERRARGAEEPRLAGVVGGVLHPRRQADVGGRRRVGRAAEPGHDRAEFGPAAGRLALVAAAGEALE